MTKSSDGIRCLAIQQPWAWLVCTGAKDIENRSWPTDHRGTIAVLASTSKTTVNATVKKAKTLPTSVFEYGAIIGVVDIVDCVPLGPELGSNPSAFGPYCFKLANPRVFAQPIPAKGKLNLYWLDAHLTARVREAMATATPGRVDDAARAWSEAVRPSPDAAFQAHIASYFELGANEHARELADRRLRDAPDDLFALRSRGVARFCLDDLSGARADLDRVIERDDADPAAFYYRAQVRAQMGDRAGGEQDFIRAAELDPSLLDGG